MGMTLSLRSAVPRHFREDLQGFLEMRRWAPARLFLGPSHAAARLRCKHPWRFVIRAAAAGRFQLGDRAREPRGDKRRASRASTACKRSRRPLIPR